MIAVVPGTVNPFMVCGAAPVDSTMPDLSVQSLEEFKHMLKDFFGHNPETVDVKIDRSPLRFESSGKIFGGHFTGVVLNYLVKCGLLEKEKYDQWGLSWFPTFGDVLALLEAFLASEFAKTSAAA